MINTQNAANDKIVAFTQITDQMVKTYEAKNRDYGSSFSKSFNEFGIISAAVRMNDKMERIKSFAKMPQEQLKVKDESIQDTLLDLANYAVMTLVELNASEEAETMIDVYAKGHKLCTINKMPCNECKPGGCPD